MTPSSDCSTSDFKPLGELFHGPDFLIHLSNVLSDTGGNFFDKILKIFHPLVAFVGTLNVL
jgi:hypothetical protein